MTCWTTHTRTASQRHTNNDAKSRAQHVSSTLGRSRSLSAGTPSSSPAPSRPRALSHRARPHRTAPARARASPYRKPRTRAATTPVRIFTQVLTLFGYRKSNYVRCIVMSKCRFADRRDGLPNLECSNRGEPTRRYRLRKRERRPASPPKVPQSKGSTCCPPAFYRQSVPQEYSSGFLLAVQANHLVTRRVGSQRACNTVYIDARTLTSWQPLFTAHSHLGNHLRSVAQLLQRAALCKVRLVAWPAEHLVHVGNAAHK